jgi:hypothetical protein
MITTPATSQNWKKKKNTGMGKSENQKYNLGKEKKTSQISNQHSQKNPITRNFFFNFKWQEEIWAKISFERGRQRERERERERLKRSLAQTGSTRSGPARKLQVGEWVGEWLSEWVIQEATTATSLLIILSFLTVWSNLVLKIATEKQLS